MGIEAIEIPKVLQDNRPEVRLARFFNLLGFMKKTERLELNELCRKIFGRSSVWQKFMKTGEVSDLTRTLDDGTEESYRGYKYPTLEEVKTRLNELLKEQEDAKKSKETDEKVEEIGKGTQD